MAIPGGAELARFEFTDKALGLGEGAHQISSVLIVFDFNIANSIRLVVLGYGVEPADPRATSSLFHSVENPLPIQKVLKR